MVSMEKAARKGVATETMICWLTILVESTGTLLVCE